MSVTISAYKTYDYLRVTSLFSSIQGWNWSRCVSLANNFLPSVIPALNGGARVSDGCFPSTGGGVRKRWLLWSRWWRWRSTESRRYTLALPSKCHSVAKEQHVDCTGHKTPDTKTRVSNAYLWRSSIVRHHQLGIYFQAGRTVT